MVFLLVVRNSPEQTQSQPRQQAQTQPSRQSQAPVPPNFNISQKNIVTVNQPNVGLQVCKTKQVPSLVISICYPYFFSDSGFCRNDCFMSKYWWYCHFVKENKRVLAKPQQPQQSEKPKAKPSPKVQPVNPKSTGFNPQGFLLESLRFWKVHSGSKKLSDNLQFGKFWFFRIKMKALDLGRLE